MSPLLNRRVRWIDIPEPTPEDIAWLGETFHLHPVIMEELIGPSARARVEQYDGYLFFIYYFPHYDPRDGASVRTEIDFIVTDEVVITIHYGPLDDIFGSITMDPRSPFELFYRIVQHLLAFEERQLRHIREKVETVGHEIFRDREKDVLRKITYLKRDVSEYRIIVKLQAPALHSLLAAGKKFWGGDSEIYLNDLEGEHAKIVSQIEDCREAVIDFEDTNNQLMNLKINGAMKTFTILSFLTFPFVLFATLFSMRVPGIPLENNPHAFWIVAGVMASLMAALAAYFKYRKWF